ncbi:MAG: hypothetical protein JKY48_16555, partial [Flavobacteriales bacterium]|nr:hypothetical protein [Flavobacteriales bacterium]
MPSRIKVWLTDDATIASIPQGTHPAHPGNHVHATLNNSSNAQLIATVLGSQVSTTYPNFQNFQFNNILVGGVYNRLVILTENDLTGTFYYVLLDDIYLRGTHPATTIPDNEDVTWLKANVSSGSSTISNEAFFVEGLFTVNENINFVNCDFYMNEDARIDINSGSQFDFKSTNSTNNVIKSCDP